MVWMGAGIIVMNNIDVNRQSWMGVAVLIFTIGCAGLLVFVEPTFAEIGISVHPRQIGPMRQDSVKVPTLVDVPRHVPDSTAVVAAGESGAQPTAPSATAQGMIPPNTIGDQSGVHAYDPSGRRDPFAPVLQQLGPAAIDPGLPPLQRVGLTEMNLIAVIWGAYGYTAMVQTPDGNGYAVRRGTRIGHNNGVVSAVTEKGIVVQERFTDVYGSKQEREYVKLLHPKEGLE